MQYKTYNVHTGTYRGILHIEEMYEENQFGSNTKNVYESIINNGEQQGENNSSKSQIMTVGQ